MVELGGSSTTSIEDAIQSAISRATSTLDNVSWFEVTETRGHVENGKVTHYQVTVKLGFTLKELSGGEDAPRGHGAAPARGLRRYARPMVAVRLSRRPRPFAMAADRPLQERGNVKPGGERGPCRFAGSGQGRLSLRSNRAAWLRKPCPTACILWLRLIDGVAVADSAFTIRA